MVGLDGDQAAKIIEEENPKVEAILIGPDVKHVPSDFISNRVRVFLDEYLKVKKIPVIG